MAIRVTGFMSSSSIRTVASLELASLKLKSGHAIQSNDEAISKLFLRRGLKRPSVGIKMPDPPSPLKKGGPESGSLSPFLRGV